MMIDRSTSATLDRIFDEMYNLISEANSIPLTDKIIIEESDFCLLYTSPSPRDRG